MILIDTKYKIPCNRKFYNILLDINDPSEKDLFLSDQQKVRYSDYLKEMENNIETNLPCPDECPNIFARAMNTNFPVVVERHPGLQQFLNDILRFPQYLEIKSNKKSVEGYDPLTYIMKSFEHINYMIKTRKKNNVTG